MWCAIREHRERAEPVTAGMEVRFVERFQYLEDRLLNRPVSHIWNAEAASRRLGIHCCCSAKDRNGARCEFYRDASPSCCGHMIELRMIRRDISSYLGAIEAVSRALQDQTTRNKKCEIVAS
jgi:hypothetical protein